ncbi:MAG: FHA domain-containing protein, partial [Oligoflexales bacterium]|nr:FHA domain-containing protein [Oligoflexales bacterium]
LLVGTLSSNDICIEGEDICPIHAIFEEDENGEKHVVTLLPNYKIKVNGKEIDSRHNIKSGDVIEIGEVVFIASDIEDAGIKDGEFSQTKMAPKFKYETGTSYRPEWSEKEQKDVSEDDEEGTVVAAPKPAPRKGRAEFVPENTAARIFRRLFSPIHATASGQILEVVAFWDEKVLEVENFHPQIKGYEFCTIGDPTKAHFPSGGLEEIERYLFARSGAAGFEIYLLPGMHATIKRGNSFTEVNGPCVVTLGRFDLAYVHHGVISYFLLFVNQVNVVLPPNRSRDPFFTTMLSICLLLYFIGVPYLWITPYKKEKETASSIWTVVSLPEKPRIVETPEPQKKIPPKPVVKVAEKKAAPKEKMPMPDRDKAKPIKPTEAPKPKPVEPPKPKPAPKPRQTAEEPPPKVVEPPPKPKAAPKAAPKPIPPPPPSQESGALNLRQGLARENEGRKGKDLVSAQGVEGPKNKLSSGVNLKKQGIGVGKILEKAGVGAIHTKDASDAGGAGGGSGHMPKTSGLGGLASGTTTKNAPLTGDPVLSGAMIPRDIQSAIKANMDDISKCYEQLLARSPGAAGNVKAVLNIGAQGNVTNAEIESGTITDEAFRNCIKNKLRQIAFPKHGGKEMKIKYPLVFSPADSAAKLAATKAKVSSSLDFLSSSSSASRNAGKVKGTGQDGYGSTAAQGAADAAEGADKGGEYLGKVAGSAAGGESINTKGSRQVKGGPEGVPGGTGKALNQVLGKVSAQGLRSAGGGGDGSALSLGGLSMSGTGKVDRNAVEAAIRANIQRLQYCYEKSLLSNPSLQGNLTMSWTINPGSSVTSVKVIKSNLNDAKLNTCLTGEISKIKFPSPAGGPVNVSYPFNFSATAL